MDLLNKLKKIDTSSTSTLTQADKYFCERIQEKYEEVRDGLQTQLDWATQLTEENPIPYLKIDERERRNSTNFEVEDNYYQKVEACRNHPFEAQKYSFIYAVSAIKNNLNELHTSLAREIVEHFNSKYNLTLNYHDFKFQETPNYAEVVQWIVSECGGNGFTDAGIEKLKEDIKGFVYYRERVQLKKNKISLTWFGSYYHTVDGTIQWHYDFKKHYLLKQAIYYFEYGELGSKYIPSFGNQYSEEVNFKGYENVSERIKKVKPYKNGKLDIVFDSPASAEEFFRMFRWDKVER